ncbi:hypothetical protein Tco_1090572, partial [Tanacetum coccineum]
MASNFNNENDPWEYSLDIDDSDLHLTPIGGEWQSLVDLPLNESRSSQRSGLGSGIPSLVGAFGSKVIKCGAGSSLSTSSASREGDRGDPDFRSLLYGGRIPIICSLSGEGDKGEGPNMFYPQPPSVISNLNSLFLFTSTMRATTSSPLLVREKASAQGLMKSQQLVRTSEREAMSIANEEGFRAIWKENLELASAIVVLLLIRVGRIIGAFNAAAFQLQFDALQEELQAARGLLQARHRGGGEPGLPRSMRLDVPK